MFTDLAGRVTVDDVQRADAEAKQCLDVLTNCQRAVNDAKRRYQRLRAILAYFRLVAVAPNVADGAGLGRTVVLLIATVACSAMAVIVTVAFTLRPGPSVAAAFDGLVGGGVTLANLLRFPHDSACAEQRAACASRLAVMQSAAISANQQLADRQAAYDQARHNHQRLALIFQGRRNRLLSADWRSLRGIPFEQFLAEVFQELGYAVETTKASGDQGVDLVVARGGHRVAIQAKGYGGSVGNGAVQEVRAGMALYKCHACVVVTNSDFTASARELALANGCLLVGGDEISALIDGRIAI